MRRMPLVTTETERAEVVEALKRLDDFLKGSSTDRLFIQPTGHPALPTGFCWCDRSLWRSLPFFFRALALSLVFRLPWNGPKVRLLRRLGARVGRNVFFSAGTWIDPTFPSLIGTEDTVFFGMGAKVFTHEYRPREFRAGKVTIRKGAFIGAFAVIPCGTEIGEGGVVAACSLAHKDVPAGGTLMSAPGRVVKGQAS